jgi:predicted neutral ceramidase superfamily lipid hydrolase
MLKSKKKIVVFILLIALLIILSGITLYFSHFTFKQQLYRKPFSAPFTLIPLLNITIVSFLYLLVVRVFFKGTTKNLFIRGILCIILDIALVLLIILPTVGFDLDGFLWHLIGVGSFCFFVPYIYNFAEKK